MDLKVTYDEAADAVYIYLTEIGPGEANRQVEVIPGQVTLDYSRENRLIGIEILDAKAILPTVFLESAHGQ